MLCMICVKKLRDGITNETISKMTGVENIESKGCNGLGT